MSVNPSLVVGNVNFNSILYTDYTLRYVGIETTTPNYTLTVNCNAYIEDDLYVANSAIVYQNMSVLNDLFVEHNATINDNLYVLGCVGIGTNVANYTLTVDGIEYNERVKVGTQVLLFTPPNYWQQIAVFSDTAFLTASYVCNYESTYSDICGNGKIIVNMRDTGFGASNTTFNLIQTDAANGGLAIDDGYIVTNGGNVEIWVHYKTNIFSYIRVVSETFSGSITPSMGITTPSSTFSDAGFAVYLGTVSAFLRAQIFPQVRATGIGTTNTNTNFLVSGRVGIGSATPGYSLDVNGISRTTNLLVKDGQPDNVFTVGTCFAPAAALAFNTNDTSLVNHSAALSLANYDLTDNSSVYISFDSKNGSGEFVSGAQIAAKFVFHPNGGGYPNTDLVFTTVSSTSQATERLRIASSGNIGINTSVPNNTLTVNGNAYIADNLIVQNTVFIENSVTLNDNLYVLGCVGIGTATAVSKTVIYGQGERFYFQSAATGVTATDGFFIDGTFADSTAGAVEFWNYENQFMRFGTNGTERMRITAGGNVGIGSTTPTTKFDVVGSNAFGYVSKVLNTDAEGYGLLVQVNQDGDTDKPMLMLQNATNEYFAVKGAGPSYFLGSGVGIGTTSPSAKLDIWNGSLVLHGDAATESVAIYASTSNLVVFQDPVGFNWIEYDNPSRALTLGGLVSQSADRLWIVSNGNVGMGTSSPTQKLQVQGNLLVTGLITDGSTYSVVPAGLNFTLRRTPTLNFTSGASEAIYTVDFKNFNGTNLFNSPTTGYGKKRFKGSITMPSFPSDTAFFIIRFIDTSGTVISTQYYNSGIEAGAGGGSVVIFDNNSVNAVLNKTAHVNGFSSINFTLFWEVAEVFGSSQQSVMRYTINMDNNPPQSGTGVIWNTNTFELGGFRILVTAHSTFASSTSTTVYDSIDAMY